MPFVSAYQYSHVSGSIPSSRMITFASSRIFVATLFAQVDKSFGSWLFKRLTSSLLVAWRRLFT